MEDNNYEVSVFFYNPISSPKHDGNISYEKTSPEISLRGKNKDRADAGRGCDF